MFSIGQRVRGPHGTGTILQFERIDSVSKPVEYSSEYRTGDRIAVQLDDPTIWSHGVGHPHYASRDLEVL